MASSKLDNTARAWLIQIKGWEEFKMIFSATSRNKARWETYQAAREAGYQVRYIEVCATRVKQFDEQAKDKANTYLGWQDRRERWGCLVLYTGSRETSRRKRYTRRKV